MVWYKEYPKTIKLFSTKNNEGKGVMRPIKKWVDRDESCQPIVSYQENEKETSNIGMVLERLFVIDIDVGHGNEVNGKETFSKWINEKNSNERQEVLKDISETMRVDTPSGGLHIYFAIPNDMASYTGQRSVGAMEGVDLLTGKNSYTPAPDSQREDGKYKLQRKSGEDIKQAPEWVIDLFEQANKQRSKEIKISNNNYEELNNFNLTNVKDYEVQNKLNGILTDSFKGFGKGERNEKMTSHVGKIVSEIKYRRLSMDNGINLAKLTARNCQPPMSEKELLTIWESIVKREG